MGLKKIKSGPNAGKYKKDGRVVGRATGKKLNRKAGEKAARSRKK